MHGRRKRVASLLLKLRTMTIPLLVGLMVTWLTTTSGGQSGQTSSQSSQVNPGKTDQPSVLVGCITADQARANQFTLADEKAGVTYRLNGTTLNTYSGRRVRIVGGLYPSTNVAAQASAIDPTKAAIAATTPNEPASVQLQEFRVKEIRQLRGSCNPSPPK